MEVGTQALGIQWQEAPLQALGEATFYQSLARIARNGGASKVRRRLRRVCGTAERLAPVSSVRQSVAAFEVSVG